MLGVSSLLKSRAALQLENLALRHRIGVFQRSAKNRLSLNNSDRLLWIGLSRVWTNWHSALVIVKPDMVIALASQNLSYFLDVESPARSARTSGGLSGDSRTDRPNEPRESQLGRTAYSR
jgi:hypothetical protein